jgi:methionyl-tRNA formyltransferase
MSKEKLRIVYMGTPDFAVLPLQGIIQAGFNVVGVITVADKAAGRGRSIQKSPVKVFAEENKLPVLQPSNLKDPAFLDELASLKANIQVVVAFRMLPEVVWNMPSLGTINLHASLLPNYRGAAPINWAIINGEEYTGVSTFFLKHAIDTGDILLQDKVKIEKEDDAGILHDKLMHSGSELLVKTLTKIASGEVDGIDQNELISDPSDLKKAPKLFKADCKINFDQKTIDLYNFIRGLSPYPAAFTEIELANGSKKTLKIFKTEMLRDHGQPGEFKSLDGQLLVYTRDGALKILSLQMEGKKRMNTQDFLRGTELKS